MIRTLNKYVVFRYIISGGTSAFVDLVLLYVLNSVVGMYYLLAAVLAFLGAFFVSFTLHKFWTFKKEPPENNTTTRRDTHKQMLLYLGTSLCGLSLNTFLMYVFVDKFHVMVILSQVCVGAMVACCTFFISRNFVFKYQSVEDSVNN